jgi:hypothetical protein
LTIHHEKPTIPSDKLQIKGEEMPKKKYEKYVFEHGIEIGTSGFKKIQFIGERDYNSNFSLICLPVMAPTLMEKYAHSHDFDIYLTLMGFHPDGLKELGGEVEFYLGKEQEKYIITTPTSFYIPKGMIHCPMNFKRVDKPILLVHATLATKYVKGVEIK